MPFEFTSHVTRLCHLSFTSHNIHYITPITRHCHANILPSNGQGNDSSPPPPPQKKRRRRKKEEEEEEEYFVLFRSSFFIVFNRLTVAVMSFCSSTKGISPKICRLCVCVIINRRSFEAFMCKDLVLERWQSHLFQTLKNKTKNNNSFIIVLFSLTIIMELSNTSEF